MKLLTLRSILLCITFFVVMPVYAKEDATYLMAITNRTNSDVSFSLNKSRCITFLYGSKCASNSAETKFCKIGPDKTFYISFRRDSNKGCIGEQGWLAIRAFGEALPRHRPEDNDYQEFWFDNDGGFDMHGHNSEYPRNIEKYKSMGAVSTMLDFQIGWEKGYDPVKKPV